MAFAIVADFPLGVYRGHVASGEPDIFPSPARLHAAFLAAAALGTRAERGEAGQLGACPSDAKALAWLEEHPPDGVVLPAHSRGQSGAIAFRDVGLLKPKQVGTKRVAKQDTVGVSISGSICWAWETDPPEDVRWSLDALCPDVPYLGQGDSPVRLRVQDAALPRLTHSRQSNARLGSERPGDIDLAVPRPGRVDALSGAYAARIQAKVPSPRQDACKSDEKELPSPEVLEGLGRERFQAAEPAEPPGPWQWCWIVPFKIEKGPQVGRTEAVAFSVALRKTLISYFDDDAPPLLTGRYAKGVPVPPNRLAIQVLSDSPALAKRLPTEQALSIAIPRHASPADIAIIGEALAHARQVRSRGRTARLWEGPERSELIDASAFWASPEVGLCRTWSVLPAVVESRAQDSRWTLAEAVLLSVGLVWKESLSQVDSSAEGNENRYRAAVSAARSVGVHVLEARLLRTSNVEQFLHKIPPGLPPLPYKATVDLGRLEHPVTGFAAIGQSRHLGGGMLVPNDVPADVLESWELR